MLTVPDVQAPAASADPPMLAVVPVSGSAAATNAVVATCVVFVPALAVGAVGVPESAGEAASTTLPVPVVPLLRLEAASAVPLS
jgi:hypothetical protein